MFKQILSFLPHQFSLKVCVNRKFRPTLFQCSDIFKKKSVTLYLKVSLLQFNYTFKYGVILI